MAALTPSAASHLVEDLPMRASSLAAVVPVPAVSADQVAMSVFLVRVRTLESLPLKLGSVLPATYLALNL